MESGEEHAVESDTDRLSELPGDILQKILSCVRIRAVMRMRRLSRKWRRLCESLQFIHLDYTDFKHWEVEKFARFVNNLLLVRRKLDLHTFQLDGKSAPLDCNDVRMWVGYAVKHNVKVLDVKLCDYDKEELPPGIFTCRSLQELNLQWGQAPCAVCHHWGLTLPDIINLPSLKRLTLRDVGVSQRSLNRFIARSPALEDLHLIDSAMFLDCIASTALKRLALDNFTDGCCVVQISTPHLISFECTHFPLENISLGDQPSLESARIETLGCQYDGEPKFTGVLAHVKKLALLGADIKIMLEKELPTCSVFESLTTLEIGGWYLTEDWFVVLRFLQLSPRLEKLIFKHTSLDLEAEELGVPISFRMGERPRPLHQPMHTDLDIMPIDGMSFQCPFLESVIIQCSKGDDGMDKLVNVLVASGISADKINITFKEEIQRREQVEWRRAEEDRSKELGIFEKMAEENPEWIEYDPYATSEPDSE